MEWATSISSTQHTTLKATPAQLVFSRYVLLNIKFIADWDSIRLRKQNQVDTHTVGENRLRIQHDYAVGDKVLITDKGIHRRLNCNTKGPYEISQIHATSTVCVS